MQSYLTALSELFKAAAKYSDKAMTGQLATLLELSTQPAEQLAHWNKIRRYMFTVADSITIQEIDDYLKSKSAS